MDNKVRCKWHFRIGQEQVHYHDGLIAGGDIVKYFGDVATELLVRYDGDSGLLAAFENVEFISPLYAGDYVEIEGKIVKVGNRSRTMEFQMNCIGRHKGVGLDDSYGQIDEVNQFVIAKAVAICVARKEIFENE